MLLVAFWKTKNRHDAFAAGRLDVSAGRAKCLDGVREKLFRDLSEGSRFAFIREIVLVRDIADDRRDFACSRERLAPDVASSCSSARSFRNRRGRGCHGRR